MRLGLLESAAVLTIPLVWMKAKTQTAKLAYCAAVLISAASLVASDLLLEHGQAEWGRALLLTSVCVKFAAIPVSFWLLRLAESVPAVVLGLIIAVVDMAGFAEVQTSALANPLLFTPQGVVLVVAAATSLIAALLMVRQVSLKRLLVLSTIEDVGFLLLGIASGASLGSNGAVFAATTHALAKALLFICLAAPEAAGDLAGSPQALATRYPVSAFGFLFGMLAMLGVPPTVGFLGRWRLYESALEISPLLLGVFVLSSILALIAYVLALTRNWWGPPADGVVPNDSGSREPLLLRGAIVTVVAVLLIAGIWPNLLALVEWGRL